jgi:hypothetical protein
MRKLLLVLLLLFITVPVSAETDYKEDEMTIESLDTYIVILADDTYRVIESYDMKVMFGDLPNTFFFEKRIPLTYNYTFKNKKYSYVLEPTILSVEADTYFNFVDEDEYLKVLIGDQYDLFGEDERFKISYDLKLDKEEEFFSYILADNLYDISKTTFEIVFPDTIEGKEITFSLDGKTFSNTIDELTYEIDSEFILKGTYSKTLTAGSKIYVRVNEMAEDKTNQNLIIYISIGTLLIIILILISILGKKKRKK